MFYDTESIKEESIEHKIGTNKLFKKFTKSSFFKIAAKPVTHKASKVANSDSFRWAYKRFIENNPELHLKIMRLSKPNATIDDLPEMPKGKFVVHKNVTEKDLDNFYNHNHKDKDSYYTIINLLDTNTECMSNDQYQNFATMITNLPGFRMKTIHFYEVKGKLINDKYKVIKEKSPVKDNVVYIIMNDGQFNQYYYNELKSHLSGINFYDSFIDALPKESNNCKYSYHDATLGDFDKFYKYNSDIKHKDPYMFMRAGVKENELSEEIYQQFANDIASVPGYIPCTIQIYSFTGKLFNEKYSLKSEYPNDAVIFIFKASGNTKFYAGLGSKFHAQNFKTVADAYMRSEQQMNYDTDKKVLQEVFKNENDARKALNNIDTSENGFMPWFKWFCRAIILTLPMIPLANAPLPIMIIAYIPGAVISAFTDWLALPGTVKDKIRKCNKFIDECTVSMNKAKNDELKNAFKKIRDQAIEKKIALEREYPDDNIQRRTKTSNITIQNNATNLLYEVYYQDYLDNIIANEEALAEELKKYIPTNESAYKNIEAITENKAGDNIRANSIRFNNFIANLIDKFIGSVTNVILEKNKQWLKDNEEIIKNKKPKPDQRITHTGDYNIAIKRCYDLTLPVFDYEKYGDDLIKGNTDTVILQIMQGKTGFTYDKEKDMAESFKAYFIAAEKGKITTDFSNLNMTEIYNFCYNFKKIKDATDKDKNYIKQSTDAILKAVDAELKKNGENTSKSTVTNDATNPQSSTTNKPAPDTKSDDLESKNDSQSTDNNGTKSESTFMSYFRETEENKEDNTHTNMEISGATDSSGKASTDNSASDATKSGHSEAELTAMANKWQEICRKIIGARYNALLQIAKNYMVIMRTHVNSITGKKADAPKEENKDKEEK